MIDLNSFDLYAHRPLPQVYAAWLSVVLVCMVILLASVIHGMFQFATNFRNQPDHETWEQSCRSDLYNCCCCTTDETEAGLYPPPACPEWTNDDILTLSQAFLTLITLLTTFCMVFVIWGIFVAIVLHRNLKGYRVSEIYLYSLQLERNM